MILPPKGAFIRKKRKEKKRKRSDNHVERGDMDSIILFYSVLFLSFFFHFG